MGEQSDEVKRIQVEIPDQLYQQARALVDSGWFGDEAELFREALRRFLETHRAALMEKFIRDDITWGVHGTD